MKYVLFYENGDAPRELAQQLYPAHRDRWDEFREAGRLLAIGPFTDGSGAMGVFTSKAAAGSSRPATRSYCRASSAPGVSQSGQRRSSVPEAAAPQPEHSDQRDDR